MRAQYQAHQVRNQQQQQQQHSGWSSAIGAPPTVVGLVLWLYLHDGDGACYSGGLSVAKQ